MANVPSGDAPPPNSRMAQDEVTPEAVRSLSPAAKKEVAHEAVRGLSTEAKKDVANQVLQSLPAGATAARKDLAKDALESLPAPDQADVTDPFAGPIDQKVTNTIWLLVIWAFCIVFVLAALMLFVSVFMGLDNTQIVLTVFTTVTGVLAGFISGRASTPRRSG
jgi:VIT1/CCC1 family predicted Fe2+/Mn2+ transporter